MSINTQNGVHTITEDAIRTARDQHIAEIGEGRDRLDRIMTEVVKVRDELTPTPEPITKWERINHFSRVALPIVLVILGSGITYEIAAHESTSPASGYTQVGSVEG